MTKRQYVLEAKVGLNEFTNIGGRKMEELLFNDVSPKFKYNELDAAIGKNLIVLEETSNAIKYFFKVCHNLTDYAYWFYLSTLWVSYTGFSDLNLWKELFKAKRKDRFSCIMKPSELQAFNSLSSNVIAYRVHRHNEIDWIAYTLNFEIAKRFAKERNVTVITEYRIKKKDIIALFLRRGEDEIIMLDKNKARYVKELSI